MNNLIRSPGYVLSATHNLFSMQIKITKGALR